MNLSQRNVDIIDVPNNPHDRLPDYYSHARKPVRNERIPPKLMLATVIAVCVALVALVALLWPIVRTMGEMFLETLATDRDFTALVFKGFFVLLLAGIASVVFAFVRKLNRAADVAGVVRFQHDAPVDVRDIRRGKTLNAALGTLDAFYDNQNIWAAHSSLRNMNTFGPAYHYTNKQDGIEPAEDVPLLPDAVPFVEGKTKIEQLRDRGHICRSGHSLMIGYDANQSPQYIEMPNVSAIAVTGKPRVGKTSTVKFLLAQAALMDWHIVLCDPHGRHDQGLLNVCAPISGVFVRQAIEADEMIDAINLVDKIGKRRIDGDVIDRPVLLVIDELTSLVMRGTLPPDVLDRVAAMVVEYAKVRVHALLIGHDWSKQALGNTGTILRRAVTHKVILRSDPQNVGFLLENSSLQRDASNLQPGQALYWGEFSPAIVGVPWVSGEDLLYAGRGKPQKPYVPRLPMPAVQPMLTTGQALPATQAVMQPPKPPTQPFTLEQRIVMLLEGQSQPLGLAEIETALPDHTHMSISNALTKLTKAGTIKRHGLPGKYRYTHT